VSSFASTGAETKQVSIRGFVKSVSGWRII
jgi:hypothetical protein